MIQAECKSKAFEIWKRIALVKSNRILKLVSHLMQGQIPLNPSNGLILNFCIALHSEPIIGGYMNNMI